MAGLLLIDGDVLAFRHCIAAEYEVDWGDNLWTLQTNLAQAKQTMLDQIDNMRKIAECGDVLWCFSSPNNWRNDVMPTYKSNRRGQRKPVGYPALVEWVCSLFPSRFIPRLEADDILGLELTKPGRKKHDRVVCCTVDKDLRTVPGLHLDPLNDRFGVVSVDQEEADWNHLAQTLTGDATDGYPGCPGVGPVKAEKILGDEPSWDKVVDAYRKAGFGEQEALRNAQVARILRHGEYRARKQEVVLWKP